MKTEWFRPKLDVPLTAVAYRVLTAVAYRVLSDGKREQWRSGKGGWAYSGQTAKTIRQHCRQVSSEHEAIHGEPEPAKPVRRWWQGHDTLWYAVGEVVTIHSGGTGGKWCESICSVSDLVKASNTTDVDDTQAREIIREKGWELPPGVEPEPAEPKATFAIGTYLDTSFGIRLVISREEFGATALSNDMMFLRAASGAKRWNHPDSSDYSPWQPKPGEKLRVDGPDCINHVCKSLATYKGKSKTGRYYEMTEWIGGGTGDLKGKHFPLSSIRPAAFAEPEQEEPAVKEPDDIALAEEQAAEEAVAELWPVGTPVRREPDGLTGMIDCWVTDTVARVQFGNASNTVHLAEMTRLDEQPQENVMKDEQWYLTSVALTVASKALPNGGAYWYGRWSLNGPSVRAGVDIPATQSDAFAWMRAHNIALPPGLEHLQAEFDGREFHGDKSIGFKQPQGTEPETTQAPSGRKDETMEPKDKATDLVAWADEVNCPACNATMVPENRHFRTLDRKARVFRGKCGTCKCHLAIKAKNWDGEEHEGDPNMIARFIIRRFTRRVLVKLGLASSFAGGVWAGVAYPEQATIAGTAIQAAWLYLVG